MIYIKPPAPAPHRQAQPRPYSLLPGPASPACCPHAPTSTTWEPGPGAPASRPRSAVLAGVSPPAGPARRPSSLPAPRQECAGWTRGRAKVVASQADLGLLSPGPALGGATPPCCLLGGQLPSPSHQMHPRNLGQGGPEGHAGGRMRVGERWPETGVWTQVCGPALGGASLGGGYGVGWHRL